MGYGSLLEGTPNQGLAYLLESCVAPGSSHQTASGIVLASVFQTSQCRKLCNGPEPVSNGANGCENSLSTTVYCPTAVE
jgi:hypothetical protein